MIQYHTLLSDILSKGTLKKPSRPNLPNTISLFGTRMEFDMADGFPLLTTKEIKYKSVIHELLWFLRGDTNIKYLVDNNVNIWNQDAYRWYLKKCEGFNDAERYTIDRFIEAIKEGRDLEIIGYASNDYKLGDLGKVYGHQWRNQNGVDQVKTCLERLKTDPNGRYAIIDAWNPVDFDQMALPPCHLLYQFNCRELTNEERLSYVPTEVCVNGNLEEIFKVYNPPKYYLDLQLYQRSCDTFLGVPFNIASGSLLLHIFAKYLNYVPGKFIWIGGDTHIYEDHQDQVKQILERVPGKLPVLEIKKNLLSLNDVVNLQYDDIKILNYEHRGFIKAPLSAGLKN